MKITRWEGNEIIYTIDMNGNSANLMESFDFLTDIFEDTLIVKGMVVSQATVPDMTVKISTGIAKDSTVGTFLYGEDLVATIPAAHATLDRKDIIEVRRLTNDITPGTRQFKDPVTEAISSSSINTETEYKTEIKVLSGTAGSTATAVEAGYIKIAEILVPAASTTVIDSRIYNVDAEKEGDSNTDWTNSATSIYRNGSISEMKTQIVEDSIDGIPDWNLNRKYIATTSYVARLGNVYQARLGDLVTNINKNKAPESNSLWWILIWKKPVVDGYDIAEAVLYETKGYIVERYGTNYASSGKTSNLGKDPANPQNDDYWIASKGWDWFKSASSESESIPGGMHPATDFSSADYQQNIKLDTIKRGVTTYDVYRVMLDGTVVTGTPVLEAIFDPGGAKEYKRIDQYLPDDVGTRTLIDMRGRSTRAMTAAGGVAAILAEVQEDQLQGFKTDLDYLGKTNAGGFVNDVGLDFGNITGGTNLATQPTGSPITDGVNGTPRIGLDTHGMLLVRGVDYIIVIIAQ